MLVQLTCPSKDHPAHQPGCLSHDNYSHYSVVHFVQFQKILRRSQDISLWFFQSFLCLQDHTVQMQKGEGKDSCIYHPISFSLKDK